MRVQPINFSDKKKVGDNNKDDGKKEGKDENEEASFSRTLDMHHLVRNNV